MFRTAFRVASIHFEKNLRRIRTICGLLLLLIVTDYFIRGIRDVCAASGYKVSIWGVASLLMSAPNSACLNTMIFALITCDLPGRDESEPYVFIRSGAAGWIQGKIMAVFLYSVFYIVIICIDCLIVLNQFCEFNFDWGKILYTLTGTDAAKIYGVRLYISSKVIGKYSAIQAYLYGIGLYILLYSMLGMWVLAINTWTGRTTGNLLVIGLAYLNQELGGFDLSYSYLRYSPCSWASLEMLNDGTLSFRPTMTYSVAIMLAGTFIPAFLLTITRTKISVYSH